MIDDWRLVVSPVGLSYVTAIFPGFYEAEKVCPPKEPGFCVSAVCAVSAECGSLFLLAFSTNASRILAIADDLRGAIEARSLGSRRGAAMLAFPRGAWGTSWVEFSKNEGAC